MWISDDEITKRIWTAYFVHWCYLLHSGNVMLPSTKNYSFNPHISLGPKSPRENEGFRSNFGLGQYDVTTVPKNRILHSIHHHIRFWYLRCCGCPGLRGRHFVFHNADGWRSSQYFWTIRNRQVIPKTKTKYSSPYLFYNIALCMYRHADTL